MKAKI